MKEDSYKSKLFLLDITDELIIDIVTNDKEPFGLVELVQLTTDNKIPKEKIESFITGIYRLEYEGYLKKGYIQGGRMWNITQKLKWKKIYDFKWWKPIAWTIGTLIAIWGAYLIFIEIPELKAQLITASQPASPTHLTKQDSLNIYHSISSDTTGYHLYNPHKTNEINETDTTK